jgi:4-amino-4-deoxy-L-arabinose transferase-like glycosyltransferase
LLPRLDRAVLVLACASVLLTFGYALYLQPDFDAGRNDQVQYIALARGLLERGEFTRATVAEPFIPEPLRFPGYAALIAPLCAGCSPWLIIAFQSLVLAGLVLLVARLARPLVGEGGARIAAALVALHPAFSFFAAHILSDLVAAALAVATCAVTASLASRADAGRGLAMGLLAGATTLVRPFVIFVGPLTALVVARRSGARALVRPLFLATLAFGVLVAPYVAYVETNFGRPVVGSTGAQLWLGYFQGLAPEDLDATERAEADAGRAALARFDAIADRVEQAQAFVALDDELRSRALRLIAHDPVRWALRGAIRSIVLWTGDVPVRPEHAGALLVALWSVANLVLLAFGVIGAVHLARQDGPLAALPLALIVATWVLSFPLWAEGRFSLPARPFVAIGAAAFAGHAFRAGRSA